MKILDNTGLAYLWGKIKTYVNKRTGVEEGTIVHINKSETTPEGWEDVIDEDEITLIEPSVLFTVNSGFTLLADSNIFKHRNRYFGSITIQKNNGKFSTSDENVVTFKKTVKTQSNTGCWLGGSQWATHNVGYCFIGSGKIAVSDRNGTGYYNYAKITFDIVTNETSDTKPIKKVAVTELDPKTGSIFNGTNIDDKTSNTYSANVIDRFNTYSTTETFTGKYWIDGKKIYKKTITGGLTEASPMFIIIGQNIEDFIDTYGFIRANAPTPMNTYWSEGLKSLTQQHYNNPNQLDIYFGSDFKNTPFEVTIEYTKTTD